MGDLHTEGFVKLLGGVSQIIASRNGLVLSLKVLGSRTPRSNGLLKVLLQTIGVGFICVSRGTAFVGRGVVRDQRQQDSRKSKYFCVHRADLAPVTHRVKRNDLENSPETYACPKLQMVVGGGSKKSAIGAPILVTCAYGGDHVAGIQTQVID